MAVHPIAETFALHNRINLYLPDAVEEPQLAAILTETKGRNAGEQFAPIHNLRLLWLKAAAPALLGAPEKIAKEEALQKQKRVNALEQPGEANVQLLYNTGATGRVKGFKPHATAWMGYLISHESHHRGQIILTLKRNGYLPGKKTLFGIGEWA